MESRNQQRLDLALLGAIAAAVFLVNLGTGSLRDWDEATYAQVAREMVATGDWLTPRWGGDSFFDKPPLTLWAMAAGYSVVGVGEGATRFGSALAGIATVLLTYALVRRALGRRVALLAGLILLGTPHFLKFGKMGMTDVPLTFFVTLSLYAYWRARVDERWLLAAGAAFGLAFMTKHAAAVYAPAAGLLHALAFRELGILRSRYLIGGAAVALAVLLPWHLLMLVEWRGEFWDSYVGYHMLSRGLGTPSGHEGGTFYYLGVLVEEQRPWFLLSFAAVPYCAWFSIRHRRADVGLFACWAVGLLVVVTLIRSRLEWYLMPVYPALAACGAFALVQLVPARHFAKITAAALVVVVVQVFASPRVLDLDYSPTSKVLGEAVGRASRPGEQLCVYGIGHPAIQFYADRPLLLLDRDEVASGAPPRCSLLATHEDRLSEVRASLGLPAPVVASAGDRVVVRLADASPPE